MNLPLAIYNFSIFIWIILMNLVSRFHTKASLFVNGRRNIFKKAAQLVNNKKPIAWFHCASLGEFEQARPIIESFLTKEPHYQTLITFFSPSGYEVMKNYDKADYVFYLPYDTARNAHKWLNIIQPSVVFFIKYEFWYHFYNEIEKRNIPLFSVSSIFRKNQIFFKPFGKFYRSILGKVTHFFVQNKTSEELLKSIEIEQVTVTGDTRFDRVATIVSKMNTIPIAECFAKGHRTWVLGSIWQEDMDVLTPMMTHDSEGHKYIIAPHEITQAGLSSIEQQIGKKSIRFSKATVSNVHEYDILLIDNVGMLSSLYHYGDYAYVGGGFGKGLHNILEAATHEMPIFFGNKNYQKFKEAVDLVQLEGAFAVADYHSLSEQYKSLNYEVAAAIAKSYVTDNTGATEIVIAHSIKMLAT